MSLSLQNPVSQLLLDCWDSVQTIRPEKYPCIKISTQTTRTISRSLYTVHSTIDCFKCKTDTELDWFYLIFASDPICRVVLWHPVNKWWKSQRRSQTLSLNLWCINLYVDFTLYNTNRCTRWFEMSSTNCRHWIFQHMRIVTTMSTRQKKKEREKTFDTCHLPSFAFFLLLIYLS